MLASSVALSLMAVLVKWLTARLPIAEVVFGRAALSIPLLVWLTRRRGAPLLARDRRAIAARVVFGAVAMFLIFYGLQNLPLADVSMLTKTQPVWVALLAPLFLRERAGPVVLICLALSVGGAALVLQPSFSVGNRVGLAVLLAAAASSLAHLSVRRLSAQDDPATIVLDFVVFLSLVSGLAMLPDARLPTLVELSALLGVALSATTGQLLLTRAYAADEAPGVATAGLASVVFAILLGWVFWGHVPAPAAWLGGGLIVTAALVLLWSRRAEPERRYRPDG